MRERYGWGYGVPAYALASFVGYSRVESRQHYAPDVIAGAAIGILSSCLFTRSASYYPDPDFNQNGQIDDAGEFYQTGNFTNNIGLGKYQRMLIAQAISQTAGFSNVMFEVSNEPLGADANWIAAVVAYAKTLTINPITQIGGARAGNIDGWSEHDDNTPAQAKSNAAAMVGLGVPAWGDPDGPALSDANVSSDDLRRAAWYSFAGGAAGWGGFTVDYWSFGRGFNRTTACYYRNLQAFIQDSGVQFWNMVPSHYLVSNNGANSCLARTGEYVVYVLSDASVNVDLTGLSGSLPTAFTIRARVLGPLPRMSAARQPGPSTSPPARTIGSFTSAMATGVSSAAGVRRLRSGAFWGRSSPWARASPPAWRKIPRATSMLCICTMERSITRKPVPPASSAPLSRSRSLRERRITTHPMWSATQTAIPM